MQKRGHLPKYLAGVAGIVAAVSFAGCLTPTGGGDQTARQTEASHVRLYCGGGVRGPVSECLTAFRQATGIAVNASFGPSGQMFEEACQQEGDVYLAGDIRYIQDAHKQGRVLARRTVCSVMPVLAVPRGNPKRILRIQDLGRPGVRFYLADPARCQQGILGERLLAAHGLPASALTVNRVADLPEGEKLPSLLTAGKLDAALVWEHGSRKMGDKVEILRLPELAEAACPVAAVILGGCRDRTAAERLLEYLSSRAAGEIFRRHGFGPPATKETGTGKLWQCPSRCMGSGMGKGGKRRTY